MCYPTTTTTKTKEISICTGVLTYEDSSNHDSDNLTVEKCIVQCGVADEGFEMEGEGGHSGVRLGEGVRIPARGQCRFKSSHKDRERVIKCWPGFYDTNSSNVCVHQ